jgi:hypothetical protein
LRIASDQGYHNDLGLLALKVVHGRDPHAFKQSSLSGCGRFLWCGAAEILLLERFKVLKISVIDAYLEHRFHPTPEFMELAQIRRNNRDFSLGVFTLAGEMGD